MKSKDVTKTNKVSKDIDLFDTVSEYISDEILSKACHWKEEGLPYPGDVDYNPIEIVIDNKHVFELHVTPQLYEDREEYDGDEAFIGIQGFNVDIDYWLYDSYKDSKNNESLFKDKLFEDNRYITVSVKDMYYSFSNEYPETHNDNDYMAREIIIEMYKLMAYGATRFYASEDRV